MSRACVLIGWILYNPSQTVALCNTSSFIHLKFILRNILNKSRYVFFLLRILNNFKEVYLARSTAAIKLADQTVNNAGSGCLLSGFPYTVKTSVPFFLSQKLI